MIRSKASSVHRAVIPPVSADPAIGLTQAQVHQRIQGGWAAGKPPTAGKTEAEIFAAHVFTFFNLVFVVLGFLLVLGGSSPKNMTFLLVAAWNALIGIVQEIRAKRAVAKLSVLAQRPVRLVREGRTRETAPEELVRDDIALLSPGDQIPGDGILRRGQLRVNESLLTGEADPIVKLPGDELKSGSFVLSGHGRFQLTAVGADSFAARLTAAAKANPRAAKSQMMRSLDQLIRVVGLILIPMGILLLRREYAVLALPLGESVEGTVAALVGMIPEGLYLLTSIAMAASALKLSRDRVLVQDMNCIESLARCDVLCVDKTGTITENTMAVEDLIPLGGASEPELAQILAALYAPEPDNDTARAIAARYPEDPGWICRERIPFSSEHKWIGGSFPDRGAYLAGAPEFILNNQPPQLRELINRKSEQGCRCLLIAAYDGTPQPGMLEDDRVTPLGLCLLTSPLRENARKTFGYFASQGVSIRVISGDSARTAARVAQRAGIPGAENYIDASTLRTPEDIARAAEAYRVFGRVTPEQKRQLIAALQNQGHTVAMTGDGVNDLLAMKQADCSVAMAGGAQAATQVASMVLLNQDFAAMPGIVAEGRRVINNIQRSAALFLVKNILSMVLSLVILFTAFSYPFQPIHLTLIGSLTIGIPGFLLALEPNYERIRGNFLRGVLRRAFPGGLSNVVLVLIAQAAAHRLGLSAAETGTVCTGVLAAVGLMVLHQVCRPFRLFRGLVWGAMALGLVGAFVLLPGVFDLHFRTTQGLMLLLIMTGAAAAVFFAMVRLFDLGDRVYLRIRDKVHNKKQL